LLKNKKLTSAEIEQFHSLIYAYYYKHGRIFSWREQITPYRVVVSEVMLQQTQTDRVAKKYDLFISQISNFDQLAYSSFECVLRLWTGLGYNRRAQALQKIARLVVDRYGGHLPDDPSILQTFPGIGPATAASIATFAFNKASAFIETNIRTVFIHTFFATSTKVLDADILSLVEQTIDHNNPRHWYYALMDYGVMLKKNVGNVSRASAHYTKQTRFEGSDRQIRGRILQILLDQPGIDEDCLVVAIADSPDRTKHILNELCEEKFVCCRHGGWWIVKSL
jgi:A/G-specific adenine glycosylase